MKKITTEEIVWSCVKALVLDIAQALLVKAFWVVMLGIANMVGRDDMGTMLRLAL